MNKNAKVSDPLKVMTGPNTRWSYANGKPVPALSLIKAPLRDGDLDPILTRSEVYSGVYVCASITFYAFNSSSNKGITSGLNDLQKVCNEQPLVGKASAEPDFATDDDEDFLA
jgi:hypothetical protein